MAKLSAEGIGVDLPDGWEGEIYRRDAAGGLDADLAPQAAAETTGAVVHLANFPLPPGRGDFGSGAVEVMRRRDVFVALFEYDRASARTALFDRPLSLPLKPDAFSTTQLQRPLPGQGGTQVFFSAAGRAFCLYVVVGSFRLRAPLVAAANAILRTLKVG